MIKVQNPRERSFLVAKMQTYLIRCGVYPFYFKKMPVE